MGGLSFFVGNPFLLGCSFFRWPARRCGNSYKPMGPSSSISRRGTAIRHSLRPHEKVAWNMLLGVSGFLKRYVLQPFETCCFVNTKIKVETFS